MLRKPSAFDDGKSIALLVLVAGLSLLNLFGQINSGSADVLSAGVSAIGLVGVLLSFLEVRFFKPLLWVWIAAQTLVIERAQVGPGGLLLKQSLLDFTQGIRFVVGFNFSDSTGGFAINFNVLTVGYFILLRSLKKQALVGKSVRFYALPDRGVEGPVEIQGLITGKASVGDDAEAWMIVRLNEPVQVAAQTYDRLLVQTDNNGHLTGRVRSVRVDQQFHTGVNVLAAFADADWLGLAPA